MAFRISRSHPTAEDVVQETYLRAFARRHELRELASCRGWLVAICRSVSLNRLKKESRRQLLAAIVTEDALPDGLDGLPGVDLDVDALAQLGASDVGVALEGLPSTMKEAVTLRDVGGLSYDEIAAIQGVPTGTVRSRIARGHRRLAHALSSMAQPRDRKEDR